MIGFLYILRFRHLTKIGIANANLERRYRDIDRTTKGEQRMLFALLLFNPRRVEASLHRRYARYRTRLQGSGGTEWFRLGILDRADLYTRLIWIQVLHFAAFLALAGVGLWVLINAPFFLGYSSK